MNNIIKTNQINIEDLIYEIRGKQVMLASDVAKLYQVETKRINEVIKRNINRFPESFCFKLTTQEIEELNLRSQFATLNKQGNSIGMHYKYLPYVLTEQGIMMLSGLLKSDIAVKVNIQIIDAFVNMRKYIKTNLIEQTYINNLVLEHDTKINKILDKLDNTVKNHIFFKGQIYDAYSLLLDIINKSKQEIIIIDNYADKKLLDILTKTKKQITLYTKNTSEELIKKYQTQYNNLTIIKKDNLHDRFIIIDKKILYHSGASFKDLGKNCFAINEVEDKTILENLLTYLKQ